ncbi:hypothetical protein BUALT_Bualt11G0048100 [Buddleja alternifolia]|uniref:Uncharacterized protein n=1 Tax=Buddleja alternifolia TaxID=168488 RepID=A0AAV6X3D8_9LAMI|nr:hypothetical protein BUALT_Bualt11G0048100 [Buddleja alternifolia]
MNKRFILPAIVLLLLLICKGVREVKAVCTEEISSTGPELCHPEGCLTLCRQRHGPRTAGRCLEVDTCFCQYSCRP